MVISLKTGTKRFIYGVAHAGTDCRTMWHKIRDAFVMEGPTWWDLHPDILMKRMENPQNPSK